MLDADSVAQIQQIVTAATNAVRQDIAEQGQQIRQELRQEIAGVEDRLRQEIVDTRRHMGVLAEGLRHELHLVAEAVQLQAERSADLRRDVDAQAQETRALLRLSYSQLHQQVQDLERRVFAIEQRFGLSSPA